MALLAEAPGQPHAVAELGIAGERGRHAGEHQIEGHVEPHALLPLILSQEVGDLAELFQVLLRILGQNVVADQRQELLGSAHDGRHHELLE